MQKVRSMLALALVAVLLAVPMVGLAFGDIALAAANAKGEICEGLGGSGGENCTVGGQPDINDTIANVITIISVIAGIAAVIMIIISGFRFITTNGDGGAVASARRTLIYAVVGLVVVAFSQAIVWFVLDKV